MTLRAISPFLWLAAFICGLFLINDLLLELFGVAVLLVFIWAVVMFSQDKVSAWQIPRSWVLQIMALFWFLAFLSIFRSQILNVSVMAFCFFSVMPLTFFMFVIRSDEKQLIFVSRVLAVAYAALAVWALLQFYVFGDYFAGRAHHPFKNANSLAAFLNLGFFCSVGWMLAGRDRLQSNLALLLAALIFGGIVATGSRGALFAMIPVMVIFLIVMRDAASQHWKCLGLLSILCGGLFALSSYGAVDNDALINRVTDTVAANLDDVSSNRFILWEATFKMIKEHGIFGTGIGTYFLYFPEFRLSDDVWGAYYAHNDPLQYWVELGFLGPLLFYAFIGAVIIRTVRAFKVTQDTTMRYLVMAPFCALGAVILHTHVTFNLYNMPILFMVGFLLAVWFFVTQKILKSDLKIVEFPDNVPASAKIILTALPFVFIGFLFSAYIAGEHFTNKARDHMIAGELEEFAVDVIRAQRISLRGNYRAPLLAVNLPLTLLQEGKGSIMEDHMKDIFDQGLAYLWHVRMINPRSSSALFYLGKIQQVSPEKFIPEDMESPEDYYLQALDLDPIHIGARLELSRIYESRKEHDRALEIIEEGFRYKYGTVKAMDLYARLLQLYIRKGDRKGREKVLNRMRAFQSRMDNDRQRKNTSFHEYLGPEE